MSNEAKGPYKVEKRRVHEPRPTAYGIRYHVVGPGCDFNAYHEITAKRCADALNAALTSQAARVRELEEDREWLRSQWERHRRALNAIAWGEYDNVAFCRRLAQDELAIGAKVANDRAAATVAAITPKEPQQ